MIPKLTQRSGSFKAALAYYLYDKKATTQHRIGFVSLQNMPGTSDPREAWKGMLHTVRIAPQLKRASQRSTKGAKLKKPVIAYSLSWHPDENPSDAHMRETAQQSLKRLGLSEHESIIVRHLDEPHPHVHVVANAVHPRTGMVNRLRHSKRKLQDFASDYEREHTIYCHAREKQRAKSNDKKTAVLNIAEQVQAIWSSEPDEDAFVLRLRQCGLVLAKGRKRLVLVDGAGKAHSLLRLLKGVKAPMLRTRYPELEARDLPSAETVAANPEKFLEPSAKPFRKKSSIRSEARARARQRRQRCWRTHFNQAGRSRALAQPEIARG